jgi:phospholipid transport system substrate-binding protein
MNRLRARVLSASLAGFSSLTLFAAVMVTPSVARAEQTAIEAFKAKHEAVVELVKKDAGDDVLQANLDGLLDYDWIAEAALGGPDNYQQVCQTRCAEFEALLTQLIRENYLRMIRKAEKHPVEYVGQTPGKNGIYKVTTRIKIDKNGREQAVTVDYVMHQIDGQWQVRDIITDDISLAKTYRYEFNQIAKSQGIDGIIRKLEDKLAKLD